MQLALTLALIPLAAAFAPAARSTPRASQLRMASPSVAIPPETVSLKHSSGASATIYKFGACVTSYVDADGNENLKVRPDAKMDGSKPISGGIPFCFPQFGPGAIQQHGFARNVDWDVTASKEDSVTFTLTPSEYSKEMWDHEFKCEYTVTLTGSALDTSFKVSNTGGAPFTFDAALHSYYDISSISKIAIAGAFKGSTFLNKMADPPADETEGRAEITIGEEYDRVYKGVSGDVTIKDSGKGRTLAVSNGGGWEDTVLWNPYGSEAMGYDSFVCVESAKCASPVTLDAGKSWEGKMSLVPGKL